MTDRSENAWPDQRLQSELRATRDEQRLALAAGRLGVLRWDRATGRVSLDATSEALLGLEAGAFDGAYRSWVTLLHPDDRQRVLSTLDQAIRCKGSYDLEYRVIWPDRSVHWLQGRGQVTLDEEGRVTGRIGCMADITPRRLADEERSRLLEVERSVRAEAEMVAGQLRALQAVTMSLIRAVDVHSVGAAVLTEGVPALGGRTGSILLVADDRQTVEIVHQIGYSDDVTAAWRHFPLAASLPASDAIRSGTMVLLNGPNDRDSRYPAFRGTPMVGDLAVAIAPLIDEDGTAFGAMVIGFPEPREFSDSEQRVLAALAAQCATALRRAALYDDAREAAHAEHEARVAAERVARSLQASLLPPSLPAIPGLELGARYAPAGVGVEVGGDFYDAFAIDASRWLVVVGDVRGKGIDAAAVTGLARHTIRSIAMYEARPRSILAHLNRVLLAAEDDRVTAGVSYADTPWDVTEPRFCTVALAVIEPGSHGARVVVCSGGHPLPMVARAGGTSETVGRPGGLLGASVDIELHDVEFDLGPGEALVCFTDGIVERHRGREFFDERGIAEVLEGAGTTDAASLAARIELAARNLFDDNPHDDMAVLVVRVPPGGPGGR